MDPYSMVFIFAIGWVAKHVFAEKADEYSAAQEAHRGKYLAKLDRNHPSWGRARREQYLRNAARRNAFGHIAYLLRHGWSSTFNDIGDGWKKAKAAHEEWLAEHPKDKASRLQMFKAGWRDRTKRWKSAIQERVSRAAEAVGAKPQDQPAPEATDRSRQPLDGWRKEPLDGWLDDDAARDAKIVPWPTTPGRTAGPTNGRTPMEAPNLDAARAALNAKATAYRTDASSTEQLTADMIAGGMNADQDTMNHIAAMNEALATAAAHADAASGGLSKHQSGQEYANSGIAAKTDFLKSN